MAAELTRMAEVCIFFVWLWVSVYVGICLDQFVLAGSQSGLLSSDKDAPHLPFTGPVKF